MTRHRLVLHTAAFSLSFVLLSANAWADITGTIWRVPGNYNNAPTSAPSGPNVVDEGTFSAPNVDFTVSGTGNLHDFLTSGGATTAGISGLTDLMSGALPGSGLQNSDCYSSSQTSNAKCYSTVIEITGTGTFLPGTYTVQHDDGAIMYVNGSQVFNSAAPTVEIPSTFSVGATEANVPFTIWYMATNGNPEDLILSPNVATPEAGAISLLVTMLIGVAGFAGIFKKKLA